jgi:hypothetical protein
MAGSFFDTGPKSGSRGAVDMQTAATAAAHPRVPPAEVEESFFGEREVVRKKEATPEPPGPEAQTNIALLGAVEALNNTVSQQGKILQQVAQGSNPQNQVQAMAQFEQARRQQQEYINNLQPPRVEDVDELVTDGEAVQSFVERSRNWALQVARAEYAPLARQVQTLSALAEPVLQDARDRAWQKTQDQLEQRGFQPEQMAEMRQITEQIAQKSYQDWNEQQKFLMNPDAMRYSAEAGYEQLGGKMPARGESPPVNAPRSRGGQSSGGSAPSPIMQQVAARLGIEISPETHAKFAEFQRGGA